MFLVVTSNSYIIVSALLLWNKWSVYFCLIGNVAMAEAAEIYKKERKSKTCISDEECLGSMTLRLFPWSK